MAGIHFHLLVATLLFSQLLSFQAVPVTRSESMLVGRQAHRLADNIDHKINSMTERMDVELQDYPGSGANNRHTPRASAVEFTSQGCPDC